MHGKIVLENTSRASQLKPVFAKIEQQPCRNRDTGTLLCN